MPTYAANDEYCDAKLNGEAVTGWIIRRHGEAAYFQIEGRNGLCVPIDRVAEIRPVSAEP